METSLAVMKTWITLSLILPVLAGSVWVFSGSEVLAQSESVQPLQDFQKRDGYDPFSPDGGSSVTPGFFNLLHQVQQGPLPSAEEVTSGQDENLQIQAEAFREQQKQKLKQLPDPSNPSTPTP
jgi:hypothetical protein